jgi:hypothetical protein
MLETEPRLAKEPPETYLGEVGSVLLRNRRKGVNSNPSLAMNVTGLGSGNKAWLLYRRSQISQTRSRRIFRGDSPIVAKRTME